MRRLAKRHTEIAPGGMIPAPVDIRLACLDLALEMRVTNEAAGVTINRAKEFEHYVASGDTALKPGQSHPRSG